MRIIHHIDNGKALYALNPYCGVLPNNLSRDTGIMCQDGSHHYTVSWNYYKNVCKGVPRSHISYTWCQACLDSPGVALRLLSESNI